MLDLLERAGLVRAVDVAFAQTLGRLAGEEHDVVLAAAGLASRAVGGSSVCFDLREFGESRGLREALASQPPATDWPETDAWIAAVAASPLVVGPSDADHRAAPLVLDGDRLYLERYWYFERGVAAMLTQRAGAAESVPTEWLQSGLDRLGLARGDGRLNAQRLAAALAVCRRLSVITGGPGTGKTYTVAKILALLVERELDRTGTAPRIALLAPTGKAAARLSESIRRELPGLACTEEVRRSIPDAAATVHRFLGLTPDPRRTAVSDAVRTVNVVIVDEVSMVDLGLLHKLLLQLPPAARLILLGDPHQLASVEAGTVLADLCPPSGFGYSDGLTSELEPIVGTPLPRAEPGRSTALTDGMVELTESRRFARHPGIGALAQAIHSGEFGRVAEVLRSASWPEVEWTEEVRIEAIARLATAAFDDVLGEDGTEAQLRALERFRILCAYRDGAAGVAGINAAVERMLVRTNRIAAPGGPYRGQPILVERNDYQVGLFNGDLGLILEHGERFAACFATAGGVREVALSRLPAHATVYAMTVHKSQGSEFDEVAIVLPPEPSPLVSRELLYTAVTRARTRVRIYAAAVALEAAVATRIRRASGLRERLAAE